MKNMAFFSSLVLLVVFAIVFIVSDVRYSYADLKSFTDLLLNVSGAIFTVMGIWIAFLYPNALRKIVDPATLAVADFTEDRSETSRLNYVVGSVLKSAVVALAIITIGMLRVLFPLLPSAAGHALWIKQILLAFVIWLFLVQSSALFQVIVANISFLNDLYSKRAERSVEGQY